MTVMDTTNRTVPFEHFESPNVRAGRYMLPDLRLSPVEFATLLASGGIVTTPHGPLRFGEQAVYGAVVYVPFHE